MWPASRSTAKGALDLVVRELQADIYGLALRMLWNQEAPGPTA
jgi:hypothetical protein